MAKYPWGDAVFVMPSVFVGLALGVIIVGALLVGYGPEGAIGDVFPTVTDLTPLAGVTGVWVFVWYTLLGNQVAVKFAQGHPAEYTEVGSHIALRGVVNTLEQSVPFLALAWLHALFVNPTTTVPLAVTFVVLRFFYPFAYGMYGQFNSMVELLQQPTYVVIWYLLFALLYKCWKGGDLHSDVTSTHPALMFLVALLAGFTCTLTFLVITKPFEFTVFAGIKYDKEYKADEYEDVEASEEEG